VWRGQHGRWYQACIARAFARQVVSFEPHVVLACFAYPDGWAACRLAHNWRLPVAVKLHGSDVLCADSYPARRRRLVQLFQDVDLLIAVSQQLRTAALAQGASAMNTKVVYSGTATSLFCPGDRLEARRALALAATEMRLLFVGNLVPGKGVHLLLEACAGLVHRGNSFQTDIVGDGPCRRRFERQAARLGLAGQVHFRGARAQAELPNWYRASNLVVLPSYSEGVPNVLVEAAACGVPFVGTTVGGIPEIAHLTPEPLVPPGDVEALARAIERALARAKNLGSARPPPKVATVENAARETIACLESLIAARGRNTFPAEAASPPSADQSASTLAVK